MDGGRRMTREIMPAGAGSTVGVAERPGSASAEVVARLHVLDPAGMGWLPAQHLAGLVV
jgi:hypothetical protein